VRLLALDVGDERIGVALSDERGQLARPLTVIVRRAGAASFRHIAALLDEHGVERIIVGLPLLPDGGEGRQVASTRAFVRGLERHVNVPIVFWDERDSTNEAREVMAANRPGARRRRRPEDAVAAAVILQRYLDEARGGEDA
jgi:putative Holliday junction resolvase